MSFNSFYPQFEEKPVGTGQNVQFLCLGKIINCINCGSHFDIQLQQSDFLLKKSDA